MKLILPDSAYRRIAQATSDKEAGLWEDIREVTIGKMDYGSWTSKLEEKLEALGESIYDLNKHDLIDWHESGYNIDQAVQLALGSV